VVEKALVGGTFAFEPKIDLGGLILGFEAKDENALVGCVGASAPNAEVVPKAEVVEPWIREGVPNADGAVLAGCPNEGCPNADPPVDARELLAAG